MAISVKRYTEAPIQRITVRCSIAQTDTLEVDQLSSDGGRVQIHQSQNWAAVRLSKDDMRELANALLEIAGTE